MNRDSNSEFLCQEKSFTQLNYRQTSIEDFGDLSIEWYQIICIVFQFNTCPLWDSNSQLTDPESASSTSWDKRAYKILLPPAALPMSYYLSCVTNRRELNSLQTPVSQYLAFALGVEPRIPSWGGVLPLKLCKRISNNWISVQYSRSALHSNYISAKIIIAIPCACSLRGSNPGPSD